MSKRKVTRKQAWRINKIQEERLKRSQRASETTEEQLQGGDLGAEVDGVLVAHYGKKVDVEDHNKEIYRCLLRQNLGTLVVGDHVVWREGADNSGVVVARHARESLLARPDANNDMKAIAANIDQIIIVTAPLPLLDTLLLDSYLVAAETLGLQPIILLNKMDLLNEEQEKEIKQRLQVYQDIGYNILHASAVDQRGLSQLESALNETTSVFVGQSGVGKSSLINSLLPNKNLRVGALSANTQLGRHTTTTARLYHLPCGGRLIDSPGIREFGLWNMNPSEIANGFIEFQDHLGLCKFRNCTHTHEPDCALQQAIRDDKINQIRLDHFHKIVKTS